MFNYPQRVVIQEYFIFCSQTNGNLEHANNDFQHPGNIPNGVGWTYHNNGQHQNNDGHVGQAEGGVNQNPLKSRGIEYSQQSGVAQNGNAIANLPTSPHNYNNQHLPQFQNHAPQHSSPQRNASSSHNSSGLVSPKPHTNAITPSFAGR